MPDAFNSDTYGPAVAKLLREYRLFDLGPGVPVEAMRNTLKALTVTDLFQSKSVRNEYMAHACMAGLWLYFDFLDESHSISQVIPSTTGSLWHGIMHRRETDYPNAKYWFRKVSSHPIFVPLQESAVELAAKIQDPPEPFTSTDQTWDPYYFTDLCEEHRDQGTILENLCGHIQRREWELLFDYSFMHAID